MVSSILAFYFAGLASIAAWSPDLERPAFQSAAPASATDPDELYRRREDPASAKQAVEIFAARAAAGQDFDAAWKTARGCYWLGTMGPPPERRAALERGITAGEFAVKIQPNKPEGYYWQAANMGALAESFGLSQGLKYRGRIKEQLLIVQKMDPAWLQGSADRALGWWYHRVPGLFGGSESKAEAHLRQALVYNPQSTATLFFLGEVLLERGKKNEGRRMLQQVLEVPVQPDWEPENREFKRKAEVRLKTIK
jgi:tetratricopeptide (TPR) repeat protein